MVTAQRIRIGTRKSPLALAQAELVRAALLRAAPGLACELVPMTTTGDRRTDRPLADIGGKGLFTKELEEGLFSGEVDIAVHSLKDMETRLPTGLTLACCLERADPRDALIAPQARTLAALPQGARVGTSSLRRGALLKILRPDIEIVPFRGNVQTRLAKLADGEADATLLALAGLTRLGLEAEATDILGEEIFLPAVGQGVIAIEARERDEKVLALLRPLNHAPTELAASAERSLLAALDGSCRTPIAAYATVAQDRLRLSALVARPDGSQHVRTMIEGAAADADALGRLAAERLLAEGGAACLG